MNIRTIHELLIILILLVYLGVGKCFECYVGENSDYQALRCLSCQVVDCLIGEKLIINDDLLG